ncbi:PREDICTED: general transcription factor 3C polypeptide 5 isoform X2 [Trachymyrmex cornetzi]|uniref:general transcription factor 3C polypeptide 5 isoform X2 n=1 Tax=Trachymyrmex cornetzi TaxID=471704 RepID=UPI00084F3F20|nr:PREDICTED: general transcription factor 3C polypeptide 5 isoform X2 [Trachymyrmex cornetzi]
MMSEGASDSSDIEMPNKQDDKDIDFNVDDYCHEIDSDDSFIELPENNINIKINNQQDGKYAGPIISGHRFDKKLICIKYPGNIINVDKAIETLGGISSISMEKDCSVNFIHCNNKGAAEKKCATDNKNLYDTCTDKSLLKRKKNPFIFNNNKYENLCKRTDYEVPQLKILGRIETEFKITNLCDFQYVPMTQNRSNPKKLECVYSLIYPTGIPLYSWLKNDVPYFLPPAVFSRMDTVQQYIPKTETDSNSDNVIGTNKKSKAGFPSYVYFSTSEVPTAAPKGIETAMKVKFLQNTHLEQVRQLFEERPIWSKNAIMYKTRFTSEQLKILLPSVAYYFMTGPWRIMWVKLGYDPRKDVNARKYQTLDYRLKAMHGLGSTVRCKRNYSNYTLPYKSAPVSKQKPAVLTATLNLEQNLKKERHLYENVYIYREGMVPPSRQMFYQYCDVLVAEIQEMLAKLPDPLPGVRCHEKRGWLPTDFDVQCREILNKQVRAVLRKRMNIPEDHPTSLPRKRKYGIKLKYNKMINKKTKKNTTNSTEIQANITFISKLTTEHD